MNYAENFLVLNAKIFPFPVFSEITSAEYQVKSSQFLHKLDISQVPCDPLCFLCGAFMKDL